MTDEDPDVREKVAESRVAWEALLKQHPNEGLRRLGAFALQRVLGGRRFGLVSGASWGGSLKIPEA